MSAYYREWLERHCKEKQALLYFPIITCAYCDKVFIKSEKNYIRTFIKHLHDLHGRTELDGHSRCKELKEKFEIKQNQLFVGVCKEETCKLQIIFYRGIHLLQNHLEICHGNRSSIYINIIRQNMKAQHILLNNYLITSDNKAHCLICKNQIDLSNLELQTEEILDVLKNHWANHFKRKMQWADIYRLEQLQQRVDKKLMKELQISHDIEKTYLEFPSEEIIEKLQNFDKIIEEVVDCLERTTIMVIFKIMRMSESELRCIRCLRKVMYDDRVHILKNHWELYHGLFSLTYKEIIDIKIVRDILDQYIILNNILVCLNCKDLFEVNALLLDVEEQLVILLKHWHIHIGISSDDQIKQEEYLRKEFRRKLNGEEELVDMLENSGRDDQGQQSSNRDENTAEQLDELHPQIQQWFYEQYIEQIMKKEEDNIDIQKNTAHKEKEKNFRKVDELLKKYHIRPVGKELKCLKCNIIIKDEIYKKRCFYRVRNHFEIYHGKLNYVYKRINDILQGYRITNNIIWCTVCSANLDMGINVETTKEKVVAYHLHWINYHSYDKNINIQQIKRGQLQINKLREVNWKVLEDNAKQKHKIITSSDRQLVESPEERDESNTSKDAITELPEQSGSSTSRDAISEPPEQSGSSTSRDAISEPPEQSGSSTSRDAISELSEQSGSSTSIDAITKPPEQSGSSISIDATTEPPKQSESSISIDAEADCKYTVNFALPSRQSEERQSTSAQSPSTSVSSNDSSPAKQRKKETSDNIDSSEYQ